MEEVLDAGIERVVVLNALDCGPLDLLGDSLDVPLFGGILLFEKFFAPQIVLSVLCK